MRCEWALRGDAQYKDYHDKEWGVPLHEDNKIFEFLVLEGFQAGLSWNLILKKRESFRRAFDYFNPRSVANYGSEEIKSLMLDQNIIRNEVKIRAAVQNARAFRRVQGKFGSFDKFMWTFVGHKPKVNRWRTGAEIPSTTTESKRMSNELIEMGFKFVGPTICYAHMQATGMVNDHIVGCFRYKQLKSL
jgi:DNA-3-methyladenine glycosylase I